MKQLKGKDFKEHDFFKVLNFKAEEIKDDIKVLLLTSKDLLNPSDPYSCETSDFSDKAKEKMKAQEIIIYQHQNIYRPLKK